MKHPESCAYCQEELGVYSPWGMSPEGWANMKIRHESEHKADSPEKKCNKEYCIGEKCSREIMVFGVGIDCLCECHKPEVSHAKKTGFIAMTKGGIEVPIVPEPTFEELMDFTAKQAGQLKDSTDAFEPSFIDRKIEEFRKKFKRISPRVGENTRRHEINLKDAFENFLRTALEEAIELESQEYHAGFIEGRLAERKEIRDVVNRMIQININSSFPPNDLYSLQDNLRDRK